MLGKWVAGVALIACCAYNAQPQATVTGGMLSHTFMVQVENRRATIFSINVDNREYWITAKHVVTGIEKPPYAAVTENTPGLLAVPKTISAQIRDPNSENDKWISATFTVTDTGEGVDIVVLTADHVIFDNAETIPADSAGVTLGGDCEFLGYPYGGGWLSKWPDGRVFWMPFVKHCTVSGLGLAPTRIWVLDGINNHGFSGGPVFDQTGANQKIFAVISGFVTEPSVVIATIFNIQAGKQEQSQVQEPPKVPPHVDLNSGFIIAFDISFATDAIKSHAVGPLYSKTTPATPR